MGFKGEEAKPEVAKEGDVRLRREFEEPNRPASSSPGPKSRDSCLTFFEGI